MNEYDIEEAFAVIEEELLESLKKRLKKGLNDEAIEKGYQIWQADQLNALQQYRYIEDKKFIKRFSQLNEEIKELIEETAENERLKNVNQILRNSNGEPERAVNADELILLDKGKIDALVDATINDMAKAEYATLRMMDDQYRKIIFNSQMYLSTGSGTLRNAIDMATKDFYANGITSVEYKNGARVNITSYSEMALRTANKRAGLQGAAEARDEYDLNLVIINHRNEMCSKCAKFRGRLCIDNVFGNGKPDGKHPMLSDFIAGGLYHPNCKDTHSTYYEGISEAPRRPTTAEMEEAERRYQLEQKQRYNERQIRKYKRLEQGLLDPENIKRAAAKRKQWQKIQRDFIKENEDLLRRDYSREKIY